MSDLASPGGFTIAVVTSYVPLEVTIQEYDLGPEFVPDDVFDDRSTPRGRDYPFDLTEAQRLISEAGHQVTAWWRWTGTAWGVVTQPKTAAP